MRTVVDSIVEKYDDDDEDYGFIVFVSNSPECKKGMLPPIMTLCDFNIEAVGTNNLNCRQLSHIAELDLTDNLLKEWSEVITLLRTFSGLEFLNLSHNLLSEPLDDRLLSECDSSLPMRKLVLNGNGLSWDSVALLIGRMPRLEELHLCANNLRDPQGLDPGPGLGHAALKRLFLGCNNIESFESVAQYVGVRCPSLALLSLSECPISSLPAESSCGALLSNLSTLNISTTRIDSWQEVDKLRRFPALQELRLRRVPLFQHLTAHERRMLLVGRLPNVRVLNGGDVISPNEREDAERAFIRFYMDLDERERPARYNELVAVHGRLDPLVNINMAPDTHVRVEVVHNNQKKEEVIKVYQTVQQFKVLLQQWFGIPPQNMKLYYCDKDLVDLAGPEEMKWPQKALYTYNVQDGDRFIVDEKVRLNRLRTSSLRSSVSSCSGSPRSPIAFSMSPRCTNNPKHSASLRPSAVRNLFGRSGAAQNNDSAATTNIANNNNDDEKC